MWNLKIDFGTIIFWLWIPITQNPVCRQLVPFDMVSPILCSYLKFNTCHTYMLRWKENAFRRCLQTERHTDRQRSTHLSLGAKNMLWNLTYMSNTSNLYQLYTRSDNHLVFPLLEQNDQSISTFSLPWQNDQDTHHCSWDISIHHFCRTK